MMLPTNRTILLCAGLNVISACSFTNRQPEPEGQLQFIQQQAAQLDDQGRKLDQLSDTQQQLLEQLRSTQQQITDLLAELTHEVDDVAPASLQPVAEVLPSASTENRRVRSTLNGKLVMGRVEWLWLDIAAAHFKCKVDTGAALSTLYVRDLLLFERNGESWVRFTIHGQETALEAPLAKSNKKNQVSLMARMGSFAEQATFTLDEVSDVPVYSVTLGRDFLQDIAVVDVSRKFTQPKVELTVDQVTGD